MKSYLSLQQAVRLLSLFFLVTLLLFAIFPQWITPYAFDLQSIDERLLTPNFKHWLGTDNLGRDLLSRILFGAKISLAVAFFSTVLSVGIGTLVGSLAAMSGSWMDRLLMRVVDAFYLFPSTLLAVLMTGIFGKGFSGILFSIALTSWLGTARLVRAQILLIREEDFVLAARALGATPFQIWKRQMIPLLIPVIGIYLVTLVPQMMLLESFLSFMGLGMQPPYSSWGSLASEGYKAMKSFPHLLIFPGLFLFLTLLSIYGFFRLKIKDTVN